MERCEQRVAGLAIGPAWVATGVAKEGLVLHTLWPPRRHGDMARPVAHLTHPFCSPRLTGACALESDSRGFDSHPLTSCAMLGVTDSPARALGFFVCSMGLTQVAAPRAGRLWELLALLPFA